jgi:hypothetical protein
MDRYRWVSSLVLMWLLCASAAHGACGGTYQRMQVGVLPDVFLAHPTSSAPLSGAVAAAAARSLPAALGSGMVLAKNMTLTYTGNLDLRNGDCNVLARITAPRTGMASTYGAGCNPERNPGECPVVPSPGFAAVAPATTDVGIRSWPIRAVAQADAIPKTIGGIELYGVDCAGDLCQLPECMLPATEEFTLDCRGFDPSQPQWGSRLDNYGQPYLLGRGNVYVGPRQPTAFVLRAERDTAALLLDHWIANDNPNAVVLVTPRARKGILLRHHAVTYSGERRRWAIQPQSGGTIPAGAEFNVHVMGNRGPGRQVSAAEGRTRQELDDQLLNGNPNAMLIVTPQVGVNCVQQTAADGSAPGSAAPGAWECSPDAFDHPLAVAYDAARSKWSIVSPSGASFKRTMRFHVFMAGLPGRYRERIVRYGAAPEYFGRLETSVEGPEVVTPRVPVRALTAGGDAIVLATVNLTPRTPLRARSPALPAAPAFGLPIGVALQAGSWRVVTPSGAPGTNIAVNLFAPLPAR